MMTVEEYKNRMLRKNLLIILFLCLCLIGISGAVIYYNRLKVTSQALEIAKVNLEQKNDSLKRVTKNLLETNQYLQMLKDTLAKQREDYANILTSNNPKAIKQAAQTIEKSRDSARHYARVGYDKLKAKDFNGARVAFDISEKFYNGYRDSYDVYFLLLKNRDKLNDPKVQRQVIQQILAKYNSLRILSKEDLE